MEFNDKHLNRGGTREKKKKRGKGIPGSTTRESEKLSAPFREMSAERRGNKTGKELEETGGSEKHGTKRP